MAVVALVNFRGVGESVKANVVLTCVELSGLLIIIFIGLWAIGAGAGDVSRILEFRTSGTGSMLWPVIAATTLAFFAMVGFEDSVNMAEECEDPTRIFPKILLAGLGITGLIYILVSISAITLVSPEDLGEGETPLLKVVQAGAPNFPLEIFGFITMFAVANSALDQHAHGQPAGLRHEPRACPAASARQSASDPTVTVCRDRVHDAPGLRPDHLRRRGSGARRHDRFVAAVRLHRRQYCSPRPAP